MRDATNDPDQLTEYDIDTARLVSDAERLCSAADAEWDGLKSAAATAKKLADGQTAALRQLIRGRAAERGLRPAANLLDMLAAPSESWRTVPIADIEIDDGIKADMSFEPIATAGELYDAVTSFDPADGTPFGLAICDVATVRMKLREMADAEHATADPAAENNLWRSYPLDRWTRWGVTAKDIERLAAGEVKHGAAVAPVVTVGDLSDFTHPAPGGYSRGYGDIKGIGTAGVDRISAGEEGFWGWWRWSGGCEEFVRERGATNGDATATGNRRKSAGVGEAGSGAGTQISQPKNLCRRPDF